MFDWSVGREQVLLFEWKCAGLASGEETVQCARRTQSVVHRQPN